MSIEELRARILETDTAGGDAFYDVLELMKRDPIFDIGISILLKTTIDIVEHSQRRTAVMSELRIEAITA
jgi:hypothetical protein